MECIAAAIQPQSPAQVFRTSLQHCKDLLVHAASEQDLDEEHFYNVDLPNSTLDLAQATRSVARKGFVTAVEDEEANMAQMVAGILERHRRSSTVSATMHCIAKSIRQSLAVLSDRRPVQTMMELIVDSTTLSANLANVDWETSFFHLPGILKAACGSTRRPNKKRRRGLFAQQQQQEDDQVWKIVYVYVLSCLAYDEVNDLGFGMLTLSELRAQISTKIITSKALRNSRAADAGVTLFLVDLFVVTNNNNRVVEGLSLDAVMDQLSGNG